MPDPQGETAESSRSWQCDGEAHQNCPHTRGMGVGFSPRIRYESTATLCTCSCHSSCPVTSMARWKTVAMKTWHTSCTCPGSARERQRLDDDSMEVFDFADAWQEARQYQRDRKEAYEAVRARALGKSRAEIRELYMAELNARDMKIPPDPVLDALVERAAGNPLPAVRLMGEGVVKIGKGFYELSRIFRSHR
jgi:hypothetical protein